MAETVSKIFEINTAPVVEQLSALGAQIDSAKAKYNELKKAQGEYSEDTIKAKSDVTALTKEYRSVQTVLDNNTKALYALDKTTQENIKTRQLEKNSIDTNRKLYNSLYNEIVKGKAPTQEQIKLAKELSDTLKKQESALGDTRRNVGNYASGFKEAFGAITNVVPALGGLQKAQQGVNMVMSANPIGGLITLLFALKDIFSGNAQVADQLTFAFDALNKGFRFIIDTIVNTVTNFDKLTDALKNPVKFIKDLAFGTADAAKAGYEASKAYDQLTESIGNNELQIEKNNLAIAKAETILRDRRGKSFAERKKAADEIIKLENENTKLRLDNANKELEAEKKLLKQGDLSATEKKKLAQLEANIFKAQTEGEDNIRKAKIETSKILYGENQTQTKDLKTNVDEKIKIQEDYLKEIDKLTNEFLLSDTEKLRKSYQDKLNLVKGNSEQEIRLRGAIQTELNNKLKDLEDKAIKEKKSKEQQVINELIQLDTLRYNNAVAQAELEIKDKEALEQEKLRLSLFYANKQLELARQLAGSSPTAIEAENLKELEIEIDKITAKINGIAESGTAKVNKAWGLTKEDVQQSTEALQSAQAIIGSIQDAINASYNIRRDEINATRDAEIRAIEQSGLSEEAKANKIKEVNKKAAMEEYEVQKKQFEINKAISIVQTIISTAMAVVAQLANPTPYAGIALAAAAAVAGAAQLAVIAAQKPPAPPKFAGGVIGLDGAGNEYSDSIDAKLSRGESVITAKATRRYAPLLASLEESVGNKPNWRLGNMRFATGYIPTGDGGFSARNMISTNNTQELVQGVKEAITQMPKPVLEYSEFKRFTGGVELSENIASL